MENRNFLIATIVSFLILFGWMTWVDPVQQPALDPQTTHNQAGAASPLSPGTATSVPPVIQPQKSSLPPSVLSSQDAKNASISQREIFENQDIQGSLWIRGIQLDEWILKHYRETIASDSPPITLLAPEGTKRPYRFQWGWISQDPGIVLPDDNTMWQVVTPSTSGFDSKKQHLLRWINPQNIVFELALTLDDHYVLTIEQRTHNTSDKSVQLFPYARLVRQGGSEGPGNYLSHEGGVGVIENSLKEYDYENISEKQIIEYRFNKGWIGFGDKYWLAALLPPQGQNNAGRFTYGQQGATQQFQADVTFLQAPKLDPGQHHAVTSHIFAGPKKLDLLDTYSQKLGVERLDAAIDFGWFYFLTKPMFLLLVWLNEHVGNFGIAIMILTVLVKIVFYPLANKSYRAMARMKELQPAMVSLREQFQNDRMRMNQELMALYKKEKINPAAGCLPILIQIPVFFALYKVLFVTIEMRHAPFFGWIQDLSAPDPTTIFNFFGLLPFTPPAFLTDTIQVGAWAVIMGITMFIQQRLNPAPTDPIQAKVFAFMPWVFTILLGQFASGLVIYWAWNNTLSIIQQWTIMKRAGHKVGRGRSKKAAESRSSS